MAEVALPDAAARRRIAEGLDSTLVVEAGAGSGKTTALVTRVVALVESGVEMSSIAAVTFTEKAAAELAERIRAALGRRITELTGAAVAGPISPAGSAAVLDRLRRALEQLDSAAIGTLHAFARRLLAEHPVEAGLPPRIEVLDEVSSEVAFTRRFDVFLDELLDDGRLARPLLLLGACGVKPDALRLLARQFDDNWDLVESQVDPDPPAPPPLLPLFEAAAAAADRVCATSCHDPSDTLAARLSEVASWVAACRERAGDEIELLEAIAAERAGPVRRPSFAVGNLGRRANFDDVASVRGEVAELGERFDGAAQALAQSSVRCVAAAVRSFTLRAAEERRNEGRLQFHDLLVLARRLLRDPAHGAAVRRRLHDRYQRILLDEFQDTDPIQIELAVRIAAADPGSAAAGTAPWPQVDVTPGHLFVVGDPKQSIYRFRRADVATFLAAERRLGAGGNLLHLTTNFRSVAPLIDWVNHTFGSLMPAEAETSTSQPRYVPLDAVRAGPAPAAAPAARGSDGGNGDGGKEGGDGNEGDGSGDGSEAGGSPVACVSDTPCPPPPGHAVTLLGAAAHPRNTTAATVREREAADVAAAVRCAVEEAWPVQDDRGQGGWRPVRLSDIAVLVPARTSVPFLEEALDAAGIPFRAEATSLVYTSGAVRDLLMVMRAVADPTNRLHTLAALRTPLLACGDDDLFRFRVERGGHLGLLGEQPETVPPEDPVLAALGYLRSLHGDRSWLAPPELLERVVRERRVLELCLLDPRPRDQWRRVRFLVDQARAFADATSGNLRQYLAWVSRQAAGRARASETVLPETDDDAVRVMTIHAAKGLEFPVTIVSGCSSRPGGGTATVQVAFNPDGSVGYRLGRGVETVELSEGRPLDEQMDAEERIRLLYVACTRARDHLVVSLHRAERASAPDPAKRTVAELLVDGIGALPGPSAGAFAARAPAAPAAPAGPGAAGDPGATAGPAVAATAGTGRPDRPGPASAPSGTPAQRFATWQAERDAALSAAARRRVVTATALADDGDPDPGLEKRPRDLDLPPWLRGRYGTAIGRAVHGVLQSADLAGDGGGVGGRLDGLVAAQCQAEAIPGRAGEVRALAGAALSSPSVRAAAGAEHWRELYLCAPVGGRLLEGFVDLLYRAPEGLVVVDYKTAATSEPAELDRRVALYRNQGAAYALAVRLVTGEAVARVVFVFLTPSGAIECGLPDIEGAVARVEELLRAGAEVELAG